MTGGDVLVVAPTAAVDDREAAAIERYRNGEISLDVNNPRPLVADLGIVDED